MSSHLINFQIDKDANIRPGTVGGEGGEGFLWECLVDWWEDRYMIGADIVNLLVRLWKDLPLRVFAERHSIGNSPESGLHMYFSASFHFEFRANPSGDGHSHKHPVLACSAAPLNMADSENPSPTMKERQFGLGRGYSPRSHAANVKLIWNIVKSILLPTPEYSFGSLSMHMISKYHSENVLIILTCMEWSSSYLEEQLWMSMLMDQSHLCKRKDDKRISADHIT